MMIGRVAEGGCYLADTICKAVLVNTVMALSLLATVISTLVTHILVTHILAAQWFFPCMLYTIAVAFVGAQKHQR